MIHGLSVPVNWLTIVTSLLSGCFAGPECVPRNESSMICNGVPCVNGECVIKRDIEFEKCICDPYWAGMTCDRCCEMDCGHGRCNFTINGVRECLCDEGWTGNTCDVFAKGTSVSFQKPRDQWPPPPVTIEPTNCSVPHRNQTEFCYHNTCYHGYCNTTNYGNFPIGKCICDKGWMGNNCDDCCDLTCKEGCDCDFFNSDPLLPYCNCPPNVTDANFTIPTPTPRVVTPEWTIAVTLAVLVVILASAISFFIILYKKRYYYMMKCLFPFKPYENNDGRQYDAFISYRSSHDEDRHFVVYQLFPKLEKEMGFKLCIDHRDFIPGAAIANNVIDAISSSRATILLLSPAFCDSEWTQFEYQRAQLASIMEHHRIIPIMFKDVSKVENMDVNLDHIIKTIVYLKWPGNDATKKEKKKFWEKLVLSMPKLKPVQDRTDQQTEQTVVHL